MKSPMRTRDPSAMRLAAALVALGSAGPAQAHDASILLLIVPVFFLPAIFASLLAGPGRRMLALVVTLALYGIGVLLLAYLPDRVMDKDQVVVLAFFLPWTGLVYAGYLRYRHYRASHLRA
jgi:MFS family permease